MVTFLTIAFDPSFTGESGGTPRYMALPDINTEDFQAAVASAMYDVSRVNANGYFDGEDSADARSQRRTPFRSISWSGFFGKYEMTFINLKYEEEDDVRKFYVL